MLETDENLSLVLYKKGELRLENRPIPEPKDDEVLLRMSAVGICGSDVSYLTKGFIGDFVVQYPFVLGHESAGTVVKCGQKVKNLKIGDRVAIEPGVPCRYCDYCKTGKYHLCLDVVFTGNPPNNGNLCRFNTHAADFCHKLPDHVTLEEGALLEPLSIGVHACRRGGVTLGTTVLICGAGPIALASLLVAKSMGSSNILVTGTADNRLELCKTLGADHTLKITADREVADLVKEVESKMGVCPDVTIECCGAESSIKLSILATKPGGCVLIIGLGPSDVTLPIVDAATREVDIRGVMRYVNCYPTALAMVASGVVDVKKLITHHFTLEEAKEAFETSRTRAGGAIKVMIHC